MNRAVFVVAGYSVAIGLILGGLATGSSFAQESDSVTSRQIVNQAELLRIEQSITLNKEDEARIANEIAVLTVDAAQLNQELIAAGSRVKQLEGRISASEERLAALRENEDIVRTALNERQGVTTEILGNLQRLSRRPPPALVLRAGDALDTIRSAMLLSSVVPDLQIEADRLTSDLRSLERLRINIEKERNRLKVDNRKLAEDRRRITLLLEEKAKARNRSETELAQVRQRASELARQARSLRELLANLARDQKNRPDIAGADGPDAREARVKPAVRFAKAKSTLSLPVRGVSVRQFGDDDGFGGQAAGLSIATRARAQVTAPSDGWVVFAAPFRSYGNLLILDAGDGYHVLISGMEQVQVELGQFVLAGEPIGQMGAVRLAGNDFESIGGSQPVLYIEFRKDGRSIDPSPWWAYNSDAKVSG